jgi:hypothetical protein
MAAIISSDFRQVSSWDDMKPFVERVVAYPALTEGYAVGDIYVETDSDESKEVYTERGLHFAYVSINEVSYKGKKSSEIAIDPLVICQLFPYSGRGFPKFEPGVSISLRLATKVEAEIIRKAIEEDKALFFSSYCTKEMGKNILDRHVKLLEPGKS